MSGPSENAVNIIWAVTIGGLLIASLLSRRLPIGRTLKMVAAWLLIFTVVYAISLFRMDIAAVWQRARDDITGTRSATVSGSETVVRRDDDGHYRITGSINGRALTFLIDTGAGVTVIDPGIADTIALARDPNVPRQRLMTAGGEVGASVAMPVTLQIGNIRRTEFVPWIGGAGDGTSVLGVDWLNSLSSWRVEDGQLHLVP